MIAYLAREGNRRCVKCFTSEGLFGDAGLTHTSGVKLLKVLNFGRCLSQGLSPSDLRSCFVRMPCRSVCYAILHRRV
jgi:hypothetical protein